MSADLVIMAAGMGSRFGGLKQAAPVGTNGEMIIDFSVYDAKKAGFEKAVIIIRKDIEKDFRAACGKRIEKMIDVAYVYQEKDALPKGYQLPDTREKPWGTGHAILCAKDAVEHPFLVINADDYYGQGIYRTMYDYLTKHDGMCMAGYRLGNTLSDNGTVSRGVCTVKDGYLAGIQEMTDIGRDSGMDDNTIVSMNMWGLDTGIFPYLEENFTAFLDQHLSEPKTEFFLPSVVNQRIHEKNMPVRVLETDAKWYGVTYQQDLPAVQEAMKKMEEQGLYRF